MIVRQSETLPLLEGAGAHLNQVFLNPLMSGMQAIEATGRGSGQIWIATHLLGGELVVAFAESIGRSNGPPSRWLRNRR